MSIEHFPFSANYGILPSFPRSSPVRMSQPNNRRPLNAEEPQGNRNPNASRSAAAASRRACTGTQTHENEPHFENVTTAPVAPPASQASPQLGVPVSAMVRDYHFVTAVTDTSRFKNKEVMRKARSCVMHNYLDHNKPPAPKQRKRRTTNESESTSSTETPGAQGPTTSSEEQLISRETALSLFRNEPKRRKVTSPSSASSETESLMSLSEGFGPPQTTLIETVPLIPIGGLTSFAPPQVLVRRRTGGFRYGTNDPDTYHVEHVGSSSDPFGVLPRAPHPQVNVLFLKRHCKTISLHIISVQRLC